ncbi:MAG TPA: TonB family protein [Verrucomicrobiae bacterium]|nr:TonB family protein [Verrucomicrobiae bacterium]
MNARSGRRLLIAAFALSLLIHLILAINLHPRREAEPAGVEQVQIEHRSLTIVARTPPPPPKLRHTPSPRASGPVTKPKPKAELAAGGGASRATAPPTPEPTPAPTAAAVAACMNGDIAPAVIESPPPPDIPVDARAEGTSGTTVVKVQLDAGAAVTGTTVLQSSGNPALDILAVAMSREARYSPALHACKPTPGTYEYSVKFVAW